MFTILTEVLTGSDPTVVTLAEQLGIQTDKIEINGIPLLQFAALVFGLYAFTRPDQALVRVLLNSKEILEQTAFPPNLLEMFLDARAPTVDRFRDLLSGGTDDQGRCEGLAMFNDARSKCFAGQGARDAAPNSSRNWQT
jgi:hypothetical protein